MTSTGRLQRVLDMRLPALAQRLGPALAVVRLQLHAEQLAEFAVEVVQTGLGPAEHADLHVALLPTAVGQDAQVTDLPSPEAR